MPVAFKLLVEEIAKTIRDNQKEAKEKEDVSTDLIRAMFTSKVPKSVQKAFFKSQYVISNRNFTIIYLDSVLYVKPRKLNIGGFYNLDSVNDLVDKSLKHIFNLAHPSAKYGARSFTNDMAVKAIGNLLTRYIPNERHKLFLIHK